MKRVAAFAAVLCAAFAAGLLCPRPHRQAAAPAATVRTLEDDLSEITVRYGALDDAVHRTELDDAGKAVIWEQNRRRRRDEMRGAYARHCLDFPGDR
jgi:hypothetical protein